MKVRIQLNLEFLIEYLIIHSKTFFHSSNYDNFEEALDHW